MDMGEDRVDVALQAPLQVCLADVDLLPGPCGAGEGREGDKWLICTQTPRAKPPLLDSSLVQDLRSDMSCKKGICNHLPA